MRSKGIEQRPKSREKVELDLGSFYNELFLSPEFALILFHLRPDGTFICEDANAAAARLAGRARRSMFGKPLAEWLAKDLSENLERELRRCTESGKSVTYDVAHDRSGKRICWTITLLPMPTANEPIELIVGLMRDSTAEKRQAAASERDEALFEQLQSSLSQVMYLFDLKTRSVRFIAGQESKPQGYRPKHFQLLGDEVVPRLVHPDDLPGVDVNLARLAQLRDGESVTTRYRILHQDGTYRHMLDRQTVFSRSADGTVELIFGISEDITDQDRMEEEVRDLSDRLLTLQIDERRRIAQELHDTTSQHLTAAELALAVIRVNWPNDRASIIESAMQDAKASIGQARKEIRVLSYLLHPQGVSGAAFSDAIRTFAIGFGARAGLDVETAIEPLRNEVTDEVAVACFRVCQEALANVYRHAGASKFLVKLGVIESAVTLEVTDDGCGLDPDMLGSGTNIGIGIPAMRQRMGSLGGSLRLNSNGVGTSLIAAVPIRR